MGSIWRCAICLVILALSFPAISAEGLWFSTSKFFLSIADPCETPEQNGPTWCRQALFRIVRKTDCREFKPKGKPDIRYCMGEPKNTPCGFMGWTFSFNGLTYHLDDSYPERLITASDGQGKIVGEEKTEFLVTKSPNPSFQRTGNTCVLPASELQR